MPHGHLSFCFDRLTCSYLSCKVDEFNVSSTQFVGNLQETPAGQEKVLEQILEYELLLIQQLNFHLVIHTPYRPMEGLLIDLKVRLQCTHVQGGSRDDACFKKKTDPFAIGPAFGQRVASVCPPRLGTQCWRTPRC